MGRKASLGEEAMQQKGYIYCEIRMHLNKTVIL